MTRPPHDKRGRIQQSGHSEAKVGSGATPAAQNAAVMRKVGPEFDVMDNEEGLDGSRPITEAIATRQGGDVPPERGKGARLRAPRGSGA